MEECFKPLSSASNDLVSDPFVYLPVRARTLLRAANRCSQDTTVVSITISMIAATIAISLATILALIISIILLVATTIRISVTLIF